MSLLIRPRHGAAHVYEATLASGSDAEVVGDGLEKVRRSFDAAFSLNGRVRVELINSFLDARTPDWDGYDALPVADAAYARAEMFLRRCLEQFPAPQCGASPSGSLVFEWSRTPDRRFMVSVGEEAHLAFAGVFGDDSKHGTAVFGRDLPTDIVDGLRRLFP
jgi:hypothetical protein